MNKLLLFLSSVLVGFSAHAQLTTPPPIDSARGKIAYSASIRVPGSSQAELYERASRWLAATAPPATVAPAGPGATSRTLVARVSMPMMAQLVMGTPTERIRPFSASDSLQCTLWRQVKLTIADGLVTYDISEFEIQPRTRKAGAAVYEPRKASAKPTSVEEYLNRGNAFFYTRQGQSRVYVASILKVIDQQSTTQVASLRAALNQ